jgi:hypothetical protein
MKQKVGAHSTALSNVRTINVRRAQVETVA